MFLPVFVLILYQFVCFVFFFCFCLLYFLLFALVLVVITSAPDCLESLISELTYYGGRKTLLSHSLMPLVLIIMYVMVFQSLYIAVIC